MKSILSFLVTTLVLFVMCYAVTTPQRLTLWKGLAKDMPREEVTQLLPEDKRKLSINGKEFSVGLQFDLDKLQKVVLMAQDFPTDHAALTLFQDLVASLREQYGKEVLMMKDELRIKHIWTNVDGLRVELQWLRFGERQAIVITYAQKPTSDL